MEDFGLGIKLTGQRRLIARVIFESTDHPDVNELHRRVSDIDPSIGLATVYRAIKLFVELGIVERHYFGDSTARYEVVGDNPHYHLVDVDSGEIVEFDDGDIQHILQAVAKKKGYEMVCAKLEIYAKRNLKE